MREIRTLRSMSGEKKRSVGSQSEPQATAPLLDSTNSTVKPLKGCVFAPAARMLNPLAGDGHKFQGECFDESENATSHLLTWTYYHDFISKTCRSNNVDVDLPFDNDRVSPRRAWTRLYWEYAKQQAAEHDRYL